MKTATTNTAQFRANAAAIAPPPPAKWGLIRGAFLAAVAALFLAAPPAEAQTERTFTITATGSGGDRDATAPGLQVNEGDTVTIRFTLSGLTDGEVVTQRSVFGGTAIFSQDYTSNIGAAQIPSGSFSSSVLNVLPTTLTITADGTPEPDETITIDGPTIALETSSDTIIPAASVTITILENDGYGASRFAIAVDDTDTTEGDTAEFTVTFTAGVPAPTYPVTVDWAVGGDVDNADHDASGGTLSFSAAGAQTINIAIAADLTAESTEDLTVTLSNASSGASITTASATTTIAASTLARRLTLTGPATVAEGDNATYTVNLAGTVFGSATDVTWTVAHAATGGTSDGDFADAAGAAFTTTPTGAVTIAANARSGTFSINILDDNADNPGEMAESFTVTLTAPDTASEITGGGVTTTISQDDDPAARAARVKTPLATFAKAATHLTAQAVSQRLRLSGTDAFALSPANFNLVHSGDGINLWASAARINAAGNDNNVRYKGDTAALHLGADTQWNDGLLGITLAHSAGDADFTADDLGSTLKTSVLSLHPYFTRTVNDRKLWATLGYGAGEAEVRENDNMKVDTDLSLLSAAVGLTLAESDNASFHLGAQWSRAELDSATFPTGQVLPKVTAAAFRLSGGAELSRQLGPWRPFVTVTIRSDSGDGDDGNAADYGAGVEWQNSTAHLRLEGRKHAQGKGPDEEHLTLTARKTAGPLNLGLNLSANNGLNTANLLTGELRF